MYNCNTSGHDSDELLELCWDWDPQAKVHWALNCAYRVKIGRRMKMHFRLAYMNSSGLNIKLMSHNLETRKDHDHWEAAKAIVSMWAGCQRKATLGFLSCSFLMLWWWHALTSSSGSVPCCAWLCTSAAAWRETRTVPFTCCGHRRGNVLRISLPSWKYYHSFGG